MTYKIPKTKVKRYVSQVDGSVYEIKYKYDKKKKEYIACKSVKK